MDSARKIFQKTKCSKLHILLQCVLFLVLYVFYQILISVGYTESHKIPRFSGLNVTHNLSLSDLMAIAPSSLRLQTKSDPRARIFLYAKHRSGSTFALDVFKMHGDIFTFFEPVNQMHASYKMHSGLDMLNNTLHCRLKGLDNATDNESKSENRRRNQWVRGRVVVHNQADKFNASKWTKRPFSMDDVEKACVQYKHVAAKEVVWFQLDQCAPLIAEGMKVVHLVRDPRGVFSSRKKVVKQLSSRDELFKAASIYCNGELRDLAFAQSMKEHNPLTWPEAYILVRYEDLAAMPNKTVTSIYNTMGIPPDAGVLAWVKGLEARNSGAVRTNTKESIYSTLRKVPKATAAAWINKLTPEEIKIIQWACEPFMNLMSYPVISEF